MIEKDTKHPYAFVSNHFYYFGQKAPKVPTEYQSLIPAGQGVKCNHDNKKVTNFIVWLNSNFSLGIHGLPIDNKERKKPTANKLLHLTAIPLALHSGR